MTPDEELDQLLAGGDSAPTGDPDAELDALLAAEQPAAPEPAAPKPSKVIEMPVQHIEGEVKKDPWYSRFIPNGRALAHGMGAGATANWGEEGAAALSTVLSKILPGVSDPEGYTREYAAGSQYADMHQNLEAENAALRAEEPFWFGVGEMLGAAPGAIATGGKTPGLGRLLGTAAAQGAVAGSGYDTENRARGAAVGGATGAATAGALHGANIGLQKVAKNAVDESNRLITQTFMTPAQRAAYQRAHGLDSLRQLGSDARDAGLFKTAILPPRAGTVAKRANQVMDEAGGNIGRFEDDLTQQGINPDVDIKPIVEELRGTANEYRSLPDDDARSVTKSLDRRVDLLEQPETVSVPGKVERPPALPEWSLSKPNRPQVGAAIEPVQEPLPGTELPPIAADRPLPPPREPTQLDMNLPRAMPQKQLDLGLEPGQAPRPEPTQFEMDLPRQQPAQQMDLGLEPMQAKLPLPPAEAWKRKRPEMTFDELPVKLPSGGAAQEPMFLGTEPAKPPPAPPAPAAPEQLAMQLPDRQMPLPLENPTPRVWSPEGRAAHQMNLPVQQELALPAPAPKPPTEPPSAFVRRGPKNPLAGKQEVLDPELINVNRGPQPELSTPLDPAQAQIAREALPFSEASKLKRFLGKQINWDKNPRSRQTSLGSEESKKLTWKGVAQQIDRALAGDSRVDPTKLRQYNQDKKNFSTAATAFDPAVSMMEREGETGLGARDLMAATAFGGGNPMIGGLASMANKTGAGMVPAIASNKLRQFAGAAGGLGVLSPNKQVGPVRDFARKNVGLAPLMRGMSRVAPVSHADNVNEMVKKLGPDKANEETKKQLNELLPGGPK